MSPRPTTTGTSDREQQLRRELQLAYETLTEVTSRLLLANEVGEAAVSGTDPNDICGRFLVPAARGVAARRAAVFLLEGGFSVGATFGLDDEEQQALAESGAEAETCEAASQGREPHVVDPELVEADVRWAAGSGDGLPAAVVERDEEDEEEEEEEEEDEEDEEEEEEPDDDAEVEEELEAESEAEASDGATAGAGADEADDEGVEEEGDEEEDKPSFGIYIPIHLEGEPVGVMALGERLGGRPYRQDELVFLQYLLQTLALTLHRAALLQQNEERLRELDALLRVSREITSTLDLDAVLRTVVNTITAVVENDRAEIALLRGNKLVLRAVSGMTRLDADQVELFKLGAPLEYLRLHPRRLQLSADDLTAEPPPAGHEVFGEYYSAQEMRSFMAMPLKDEQGLLGFLCLESRQDSWAIEPAEGDTLSILAAQTTVAIRNATLYSEIPLRGMSLPVVALRTRIQSLSARGRTSAGVAALIAVAVLALPIFPERAGSRAEVRPLRFQGARAMTEGVVSQALVQGGEQVRRGQPLAVVQDLDLATRIADLQGQIEVARRDMATARRAGDVSTWHAGELRLAALERSLAVEQQRERASVLTAPLPGQVLEMDLAQRVGQHLDAGESFCTVAALNPMAVDFTVSEDQIGRVKVGQPVAAKVMSFPTHTFRGRIIEVGWLGRPDPGGRARFTVRAEVENPDHRLRPGMTGVARASLGQRAAGAMLLEPVVRGLRMTWY
jgi:GAF domain-containing protein/biotin carboxyl carrier protein